MPENDSLQKQPRLPPELEYIIFMMATSDANDSGDEMRIHAARLTRVAKRVQEWIRPVLYSIFVQGLFLSLIDATFPKLYIDPDLLKRVAGLAKHLFIGHHVSDQSVIVLLRHCVNVRDIAIRRDYAEPFQGDKEDNYLDYLCASATLRGVRSLFLTIRLAQDDLESIQMAEAFKDLTHLDIIFPNWKGYNHGRNLVRILSGFTKLTHLATTVVPSSKTLEAPTISGILSSCAHLEIFIIKAILTPPPSGTSVLNSNGWGSTRILAGN
ncbi:hypothetical protein CPB84DRAFT_195388 [Gymnopilus junonius]|uniref:Uncharacterized protein n=1 Tax=Gymnopilus junonius TaxID=109634 RepID=A0A9P5NCZ6_GYMJU|nr:hypothetical protein CPB84DRAFT_195388 [Gymnopilus junonius]